MRDALNSLTEPFAASDVSKAEALHALGLFYVRQGFPKQGLSVLLAAHKFAAPSMELNRAIAHAYVLAGVPQKALAMLDALAPTLESPTMRRGAERLRAKALLALGRVADAKVAFAASLEQRAEPPQRFMLARRPT